MAAAPEIGRIGVAGAGTMGAGIAQLACLAGYPTLLQDPDPEALERGCERLREGLAKGAKRGRWSTADAQAANERLVAAGSLEELAGCDLAIEAAPEDLELKRKLFATLSEAGGERLLLATNTSSLAVTAIAAGARWPRRVCGMHFFNPPPLMPLVEIVAGAETAPEVLEAATEVGRRMGRTPIRAADGPGFLANRVARPFGLEALRLLGDRVADHATIDRICRTGGGFRMGPFELADLVGIDVGFEISKSFYAQSFNEPRWQPHPIQEQMTAAGRHGRKAGRGYYDYGAGPHRPDDPPPPEPGDAGAIAIEGEGRLAEELRELSGPASDAPRAVLLASGSLAMLDPGGDAIGFHALPPLASTGCVELTGHEPDAARSPAGQAVERFFKGAGQRVEWVGDAPGLVLGRIVCQLVNEAAFALQRGVGSAEDIDTAMRLGFNWPRGPLEWGDAIGLDHVLAVLDGLRGELGEERYRAAPLLRRLVAEGRLGDAAGAGLRSVGGG